MAKTSTARFTELYNTYFLKVYKYFYYRLLSVELAEDLTSDTFLAIAERGAQTEVKNWQAFVFGVAYRKLQDHLREKYKLPQVDVDIAQLPEKLEHDFDQNKKNTPTEVVLSLVDKLPPQQREIILLRLAEKLTLNEICDKIGKDMAYVKTTQNRAIKNLRKLIAGIPIATKEEDDTLQLPADLPVTYLE